MRKYPATTYVDASFSAPRPVHTLNLETLSFWARVRRVPFWKLWLFTLGWGIVFPLGVFVLGLTFGFSFGADSAAKAWLAAGLAVLIMSLMLFFAVRKKLGYGD